jgi:hypothetical protein
MSSLLQLIIGTDNDKVIERERDSAMTGCRLHQASTTAVVRIINHGEDSLERSMLRSDIDS